MARILTFPAKADRLTPQDREDVDVLAEHLIARFLVTGKWPEEWQEVCRLSEGENND